MLNKPRTETFCQKDRCCGGIPKFILLMAADGFRTNSQFAICSTELFRVSGVGSSRNPKRLNQFEGERAIDLGGVSRDMFTAFFEEAYKKLFDGCTLLTPAVHPGIDLSSLSVFGAIMSHAYLATGVLPVRIAFPTLAHCLLGATVDIPESIMLKYFIQSLSAHDAAVLNIAMSTGVTESVIGILGIH